MRFGNWRNDASQDHSQAIKGSHSFVATYSFLFVELNGVRMTATEVDAAASFLALAAGELSEADLAKWFKANSRMKAIRR